MPRPGSIRFTEQSTFSGWFEIQARGEARANPERIHGFDKHSIGADIARARAQYRRTPLDLEVGANEYRVAQRRSRRRAG